MAVGFSNTNKPINPRGQDASPLAFNRAKLYSGKALDFDGVNDYVDVGTLDITGYTQMSVSFYMNVDTTTQDFRLISIRYSGADDIRIFHSASIGAGVLNFSLDDGDVDNIGVNFETNQWYHVVMTHDGATLKAYFNGVEQASTASTFDYANADGLFYVGRYTGGTVTYYDGEASNVKIFNTALTAAQVADLYNNPEKVVPTGVNNTALKLWLPMMEGAGTKCLDGASLHTATERVENGDFSNGTTGWVGNPQTTLSVTNGQLDIQSASGSGEYGAAFSEVNFTSGKYYLFQLDIVSCNNPAQIRIGASNSATLYSQDIWASGEIGVGTHSILWLAPSDYTYLSIGGRNDVTTLVIDNVSVKEVSVGNISGATWTHGIGSPVAQTSVIDWNKRILDKTNEFLIPQGLTAGRDLLGNLFENVRKQGALNLDGNSWAEVHDNASLDITTAITLETWVKWGDAQDRGIIGKYDYTNNKRGYLLYQYPNTGVRFYASPDGNSQSFVGAVTTFSEGNWYHLVGVYDGSELIIYVNGVKENSLAYTSDIFSGNDVLEIGRYGQSANAAHEYTNQLAQPRIYNRALTASEVLQNYNSGKNTYK